MLSEAKAEVEGPVRGFGDEATSYFIALETCEVFETSQV
jgi:hypothetical protein